MLRLSATIGVRMFLDFPLQLKGRCDESPHWVPARRLRFAAAIRRNYLTRMTPSQSTHWRRMRALMRMDRRFP
jgi:hypothetical protein